MIDQIFPNGGEATVFSAPGFNGDAGTQLSSYYNGTSIAGQYLEVGSRGYTGMGDLISSNGTATNLFTAGNSSFSGVVTASSNYGSIQSGQEVLVNQLGGANGAGQIDVLSKNRTLSAFGSFPEASTLSPGSSVSRAFGVGFAPSGFGKHAGDLFASDDASGSLYVINAQAQSSLFAQISLAASATSHAQIAEFRATVRVIEQHGENGAVALAFERCRVVGDDRERVRMNEWPLRSGFRDA